MSRRQSIAVAILLFAFPAAAGEVVVAAQAIEDRKAVFGTVETVDVAAARARIGGTVVLLAVDEGERVVAGQPIAAVADPKLQLELAAIDERIRSLQAQRDLARTDLARLRELFRTGAVAKSRLDDAETGLTVAERAITAMAADRQVVAERHAEGAVLAPAAGRVLKVEVTPGMVVMPGEAVARIALEDYVLRIALPERHARFLKPGDAVQVGDRGMQTGAGAVREGRVRLVYPQIQQGRVLADVVVDGLGDYHVGERVHAYVSTGTRQGFVVPRQALYQRFGVDFLRLKDGSEIVVQPGQPVGDGIEILSGLREGDVLVTP